jgi:hypothetical protein
MQKAHLYEAIFLVNQGIDEAVRGLERLKRAKDSGLDPAYFDERLALFEDHRARLNAYFCNNIQSFEDQDAFRFEKRHREYQKEALDEMQVYQDVQAIEERRRLDGKAPKVRFFTQADQREWELQYSKLPGDAEGDAHCSKGEQP